MKMTYNWAVTGLFNVDAQEVGEHLTDLAEKKNGLQPKDVVEDAKEETALLHNCFEWNNDVAADKYRIEQASQIIRNIKVIVREEQAPVRAFLSITQGKNIPNEPNKRVYINTCSAMGFPETRNLLLEQALRELQSFKLKYTNLLEFAELFKTIDSLIAS